VGVADQKPSHDDTPGYYAAEDKKRCHSKQNASKCAARPPPGNARRGEFCPPWDWAACIDFGVFLRNRGHGRNQTPASALA
jgi:hypothetical protein